MLTCLLLLLILVISGVVSRLASNFPSPLVQIALGAFASAVFPNLYVGFNPELFMLLFIPPLLFSDSWHFPKREFLSNKRAIIMLSIGLVFFTARVRTGLVCNNLNKEIYTKRSQSKNWGLFYFKPYADKKSSYSRHSSFFP